jgi:hypothetical protein
MKKQLMLAAKRFGRGQPTKFDPKFVTAAKELSKLGATDENLAAAFDVTVTTIRNWMIKYPDFFAAIKAAKGEANERVERSLYQRGIGYNYEATKIFMPAGSKQPVVVHYLEHVPADVGAAFIWLKNRDPDRWRDVQNVEHVLGKYLISDKPMTLEEWAARATVVNEVIDDSNQATITSPVTPSLPPTDGQRKKGQ